MDYQEIIAGTVGKENTYGTVVGRVKAEPFTYCRVSTDDLNGRIPAYVGEGELTDDPLKTFGGYGVVQIPQPAEPAGATSARTASSTTWPSTCRRCAGAVNEALEQVPGLGRLSPQVLRT